MRHCAFSQLHFSRSKCAPLRFTFARSNRATSIVDAELLAPILRAPSEQRHLVHHRLRRHTRTQLSSGTPRAVRVSGCAPSTKPSAIEEKISFGPVSADLRPHRHAVDGGTPEPGRGGSRAGGDEPSLPQEPRQGSDLSRSLGALDV